MNVWKKKHIKATFKYTWPLYIVSAVLIGLGMNFIFTVTHRTPAYKTLTIFVSGEVTDNKKLRNDMLSTFKDKEIKSFSCISSKPTDATYNSKLTVAGYNSADVLIIPVSKLDSVVVSAFAIDLKDELVNSFYQGYTLYEQDDINYGVKIDKEKVANYMTLPKEDCYLLLNGKSANLGDYSKKPVKEHDMALYVVQNWGM